MGSAGWMEGFAENIVATVPWKIGEMTMGRDLIVKSGVILGLTLSMLVGLSVFTVMPALAITDCAAVVEGDVSDMDDDGFNAYEECYGIFYDDSPDPADTTPPILIYTGKNGCAGPDDINCMDPDVPDLFVAIIYAATPYAPFSPLYQVENIFEIVRRPQGEGGLGLRAHYINPAKLGLINPTKPRSVNGEQNAVRITESLAPATRKDKALGEANYGTPNGYDDAVIWTLRILEHIEDNICNNMHPNYADQCRASLGAQYHYDSTKIWDGTFPNQLDELEQLYIRHTFAHEIGHMTMLSATPYDIDLGGHHYPAGAEHVLDQYVFVEDGPKKQGKFQSRILHIGTSFSELSKQAFQLVGP